MRKLQFVVAVLAGLAACGGGGGDPTPDAAVTDASILPDGPTGCPRTPAAADRPRHLVVSRPYTSTGGDSSTFEVLDVSATGTLTRPGRTFELAPVSFGSIAFTPDGEIGLVALEDGTLGVFRLDAAGTPTVVHASFAGSFYATDVVMDPSGDRAWVLEGNTLENGGGLYLVTIGCDGTLTDLGLVAPARLPRGLAFAGDRALVAAGSVLEGTTAGDDVHLVRLDGAPAHLAGADAFGDDDAIVGGSALTADGATYLVGDTSGFSGVPNRVAVVGVTATGLTPLSVISPLEDPQAIVVSPFGDVALVASGFGDALFVLDTGGAAGAWRVRGEVAYQNGLKSLLPGHIAAVSRGALRGHVWVAENVSVRHLAFRDTGAVDDLGSLAFGDGLVNITGAIGITP